MFLAADYKKDCYCEEKHGITSHLFLHFGEQVRHIYKTCFIKSRNTEGEDDKWN